MKFACLKYNISNNLGDQIQSLAARQFLPRVDTWLNRDSLRQKQVEAEHVLIMNGWFSHFPEQCFPPNKRIAPVFFGFHMSDWKNAQTIKYFTEKVCLQYFKQHEPIGCRDQTTMSILRAHGIQAFYSKCLTLTFPTRKNQPQKGSVFLVDIPGISVPKMYASKLKFLSHDVSDELNNQEKLQAARHLLDTYRNQADLVITSRLHCALPCIAMGIPVVFIGNPDDYRLSILKDLGQMIYTREDVQKRFTEIDWQPKHLSIKNEKNKIIQSCLQSIHALNLTES